MWAVFRAVVFDLWHTLAVWSEDESRQFRSRWSEWIGVEPERIDEAWYADGAYERRETGPIARALAAVHETLGSDADVGEVVAWRMEMARSALVPVPGAVETLQKLRARGLLLGLISNCTEEVALVWGESPFAGLFDAAVFSATAGCMKPDRRIYEGVLTELGVPASAALFVGDGANDELEGARRVGMTPVLVQHNGAAPLWDGLENWDGERITSIPQILDLVA
jgi:putative hydrolase of the HAD superfamily